MKKMSLVLSAAAVLAVSANASSINFEGLEISPIATYNVPEGNLDLMNKFGYGLRIGYMYGSVGTEIGYEHQKGEYKSINNSGHKPVGIDRGYLNLILPVKVGDTNFDFYGLLGVGYENFSENLYDNKNGMFGHYGVGLKYKIYKSFGLRAEVRDQIKFRHADHHLISTLGVIFNFDGKKEEVVPTPAPAVEVKPEPVVEVKPEPKPQPKPKACYDLEMVKVNFGFDKSNVTANYIPEINRLAKLIKEEPAYFANITGYTDSIGATAYNKKLSEKRARAVKAELVKAGVSEDRINPTWAGEQNAIGDNKTKEGRAANRRVELKIICQ
ncbi:outer membrane fibronectin-binding protein [Campylobacter sp. RM5004]|uniref:OmpA family protein n=1 Tax=Campylobacter sp. RM5004 TaxID=1660078 RepID=UPI001EFAC2C8|nr:OmpA family protein [Campylobacter sp. RM5004]ULO02274.1 outer membrane fibronectin-binding protein [Campylobacter sp. RM5004]